VAAWWLSFILAGVVKQMSNSVAAATYDTEDVEAFVAASYFAIAASWMFLVATLVAAWLVLDVVGRQERRAGLREKSE
jgi:hypothetical protein